ncbi:hypothetical protein F5Y09DRAFT_314979 [Xylaria sp. FL1042]|nr:hypothetical protein F5Y09DRAFT_314979 [Xylaria sp. FL1042]
MGDVITDNYAPNWLPFFSPTGEVLIDGLFEVECFICNKMLSITRPPDDKVERFAVMPCGHIVGYECLKLWINSKSSNCTCPCCRTPLWHKDCEHAIKPTSIKAGGAKNMREAITQGIGNLPPRCSFCTQGANGGGTSTHSDRTNAQERTNARDRTNTHGDRADRHGDRANRHGDRANRHGDRTNRHGDRTNAHGDRANAQDRGNAHGDRADRHGDRTNRHGDRADRHGDRTNAHGNRADGQDRANAHGHRSNTQDRASAHGDRVDRHGHRTNAHAHRTNAHGDRADHYSDRADHYSDRAGCYDILDNHGFVVGHYCGTDRPW